jgi:hypothetical protein
VLPSGNQSPCTDKKTLQEAVKAAKSTLGLYYTKLLQEKTKKHSPIEIDRPSRNITEVHHKISESNAQYNFTQNN